MNQRDWLTVRCSWEGLGERNNRFKLVCVMILCIVETIVHICFHCVHTHSI
jgi:hypothetical protein